MSKKNEEYTDRLILVQDSITGKISKVNTSVSEIGTRYLNINPEANPLYVDYLSLLRKQGQNSPQTLIYIARGEKACMESVLLSEIGTRYLLEDSELRIFTDLSQSQPKYKQESEVTSSYSFEEQKAGARDLERELSLFLMPSSSF